MTSKASIKDSAGSANAALQLVLEALTCKQDVRLYRMAAMYACAAEQENIAQLYFANVPLQDRQAIVLRCKVNGISIR